MNLALEDMSGDGPADQRRGDIVEETREHEHQDEQHNAALPVVRQQCRHLVRNPAFLEMARQQREAHQKKEQIAQSDPLMPQVVAETAEAGAVFESGEDQLVKHDGAETGQGNGQCVMME